MTNHLDIDWYARGGVGHIVVQRGGSGAKGNALNAAMGVQLAQAIAHAAQAVQTGDVGAVLLCAAGAHFCAGGDIGEFVQHRADLAALIQGMLDTLHPAIHTLAHLPVPVLSAVQGPVGGAGIALALCADIVLASPAMKLRGGYSAIGLSPDLGASYWLARRAGSARAGYILMSNRSIPAEQCLHWGLVDELHPPHALHAGACTLAGQLAHGARGALAGIKRLCHEAAAHDSLHEHLQREREALLRCAATGDAREGIQAFLEKRRPAFAGG